jgi:ABC-2 type transport system permease protein
VIPQSAENARLIVIGSAAFANDYILNLSSRLSGERYLNNLQFLQNSVDWAVEDLDLLAIRGGGTAVRVLNPMSPQEQTFWEVANYVLALAALITIYAAWRMRERNEEPMELVPVEAGQ